MLPSILPVTSKLLRFKPLLSLRVLIAERLTRLMPIIEFVKLVIITYFFAAFPEPIIELKQLPKQVYYFAH